VLYNFGICILIRPSCFFTIVQNDCGLDQYWKERGLLAVKPPATPSLSNQKFVKACHFERNAVECKISTAYGGLTIENYFLSDNDDLDY
jgi:hypothetical protein